MITINKKISNFLMYSSFQYYFMVFSYYIGFWGIQEHQNPWIIAWYLYVFVPLMDEVLTVDNDNPTKEEQKSLQQMIRFKIPLYLAIFVDWYFALWLINYMVKYEFGLFKVIGCIFSAGTVAASNINVSHELIHKEHNESDSIFGCLTLARNFYMHFNIEHLYGHHKHVATPKDPASSRLNQTLYQFLPQTLIGSYKSAWNIEAKRLMRNKGYKHPYVLENRMLWYALNNIILPFVIYKTMGLLAMFYFIAIGCLGALYLEVINYIEHYGLERKLLENGEYEKVNIQHSWNAPQRFSNYLLFKLQRHSDHHENGFKTYQTLCTYDQSPQYPKGYPTMLLTSLFPSVWFDVVNKYVISYQKGEKIPQQIIDEMNTKIMGCQHKISVVMTLFMIAGFYI